MNDLRLKSQDEINDFLMDDSADLEKTAGPDPFLGDLDRGGFLLSVLIHFGRDESGWHRRREGMIRCAWAGDLPLMVEYHDQEWGVPQHDDRRLFAFLVLEGAPAGLRWRRSPAGRISPTG